jgi:hypothetical protein
MNQFYAKNWINLITWRCKYKTNQIEPKQQCCPDVELTYGSNEYLSNAYKWQFHTHCLIWDMLIVEDPSVTYTKTLIKVKERHLARNDMDVNDHEILSNITQNLGKEQCFNCSTSFHNHRRIFNNEHNSYHTMNGNFL